MKLSKGILIVIEGIDGAGKTTQAEILLEKLEEKGFETASYREPSESKWGREIKRKAALPDSISPEEELDLFLKDRRENVEKNLKPGLEEKKVIVLDRYYYSTIAYQGARGIDLEMLRRINEDFAVRPDLVFILDVDAQKGLKRIENRKNKDMLFEQEEYLVKVRKIFRSIQGENIFLVDAQRPEDEISREVEEITFGYIEKFLC